MPRDTASSATGLTTDQLPRCKSVKRELNQQSSVCLFERIYQEAELAVGSLPWWHFLWL